VRGGAALEWVRRWGFPAGMGVLALWGGALGLSIAPTPQPAAVASPPAPHHPARSNAMPDLRDPFLTGTDWRAYLRQKQDASTAIAKSKLPPADPPPEVEGTMTAGGRMKVVTPLGEFVVGQWIGKYRVDEIADDHVTFMKDGRHVRVNTP